MTQDEANALLGGSANQMRLGQDACVYSVRALGVKLAITVQDLGVSAKATWDGMKAQSVKAQRLAGDEAGMGANAYSEVSKRVDKDSSGQCGFVVLKGAKVIQVFVSDSAGKPDIAGKKEMLDKFRPLALKAVQRL